jgi:hypothetical protein
MSDELGDHDTDVLSLCCGAHPLGYVDRPALPNLAMTGLCSACRDHAVFSFIEEEE